MPKPDSRPSVRSSSLRVQIEHRTHGLAERLQRLPAAAPMVGALVLAIFGVVFRGVVGAVCFGVLTLFLAWLLYLAWPRLSPLERLMRGSLLLLTAVITLVLAVPR